MSHLQGQVRIRTYLFRECCLEILGSYEVVLTHFAKDDLWLTEKPFLVAVSVHLHTSSRGLGKLFVIVRVLYVSFNGRLERFIQKLERAEFSHPLPPVW